MTIDDVELMMSLKKISNAKFHKGEQLELKEVRLNLETSFPEDLKDFKDPLGKVLDNLRNWDNYY